MSDNRVKPHPRTQRERDQEQAMVDLDQSIAERDQARADRRRLPGSGKTGG
jgi:hypothetical protein